MSPVTSLVKPRMGLTRNRPVSRAARSAPVVRSSTIVSDMRWVISPSTMPPMGVAIMSLVEGYSFSMNSSHISEPPAAKRDDCQKL